MSKVQKWSKNPDVEFVWHKNWGHPWTEEKGWDGLEARAKTEEQLTEFIAEGKKNFWDVWIRDNTGKISAFLYQPTGAKSEKDWKRT